LRALKSKLWFNPVTLMGDTNSLFEQRTALGIDRLRMMLLGQASIRDGVLFPQLKPK